ncbi:phosphatidylinositol 4,5-bisphosphate 5-phosphatase A-like [Narcine bancroftii]|uniref:phosphatidylinositol 4,5-bisphosphate 5-phosphatase A-like n=1 Tax=Narcine bancroftii TaxID=1343680 RepID=UPI0038323065
MAATKHSASYEAQPPSSNLNYLSLELLSNESEESITWQRLTSLRKHRARKAPPSQRSTLATASQRSILTVVTLIPDVAPPPPPNGTFEPAGPDGLPAQRRPPPPQLATTADSNWVQAPEDPIGPTVPRVSLPPQLATVSGQTLQPLQLTANSPPTLVMSSRERSAHQAEAPRHSAPNPTKQGSTRRSPSNE